MISNTPAQSETDNPSNEEWSITSPRLVSSRAVLHPLKFDEREYRIRAEVVLRFIVTITTLITGTLLILGALLLAFGNFNDHTIAVVFVLCGTMLVSTQFLATRVYKSPPIVGVDTRKSSRAKRRPSSVSTYFNEINTKD
jgi:hypothetical protein